MIQIINLTTLAFLIVALSSCQSSLPREDWAKGQISSVCRAEKQFYKSKGRYGTKADLSSENLINDDRVNVNFSGGNSVGYDTEIRLTSKGYLAIATPTDFSKGQVFYVDESGIIRKRSGDANIGPNDPQCELEEGCFCLED